MDKTDANPSVSTPIHIVKSTIMGTITILIIVSNLVNVTTLRHVRELNKIGKLFLTNLGVADLVVGALVCGPGFISYSFGKKWLFHPLYCQISGVIHGTSCSVSIWNLACVSTTRYMAVLHPLKYRLLTRRRCALIIAALWTTCLLVFLIPIFIKLGYYYEFDVAEGMCGLYWELEWFCIVTGVLIPIGAGGTLMFTTVRVIRFLQKHERPGEDTSDSKKIARERKSIRLLVIVSSLYFIAWGPYVTEVILVAFVSTIQPPWWLRFTFIWLANSNSFVNVLIYSSMYDSFRARTKATMSYILTCGRINNTPFVGSRQGSSVYVSDSEWKIRQGTNNSISEEHTEDQHI